jgi:hypothetical protein
VKAKRAMSLKFGSQVVSLLGDDSELILSRTLLDADARAAGNSQAGWSSALAKPSLPMPADRRAQKIRTWRRRALLKRGTRLHLAMGAKAQLCSLAMLDERGVVISWYGRVGRNEYVSEDVLERNHSLFYVPEEIARRKPARDLRAAAIKGSVTKQAWRRRPDGSAYMSTIVIEPITLRDGRLQGFSYVESMAHETFQ